MVREWITRQGSSKRRSWGGLIVVVAALLLWPSVGTATTDNLKCFKIKKDQIDRLKYTVDLDGLKLEEGCQIKSKAMYLCVPSEQTYSDPAPPGYVPSPPAPPFVCYKAKCPKTDPPPDQIANDKFGSRTVELSKTQWACVPLSSPSSASTRCCNLAMSSPYTSFGCFDYVADVNAIGEWMCNSTSPFNGNTIGDAGQVCGGLSGVCESQHSNGGSCCSVSAEGWASFCVEGPSATVADVCALFGTSGTVISNATCQVDGTCVAQFTPEQGCLRSGGTVDTAMCCTTTGDFPDTCATGACGCGPSASHEVHVCTCAAGSCFNGSECVAQ